MSTSCSKLSTKSSWAPLADLLVDISCLELLWDIFENVIWKDDYEPVDMDGVNHIRAELGHLPVLAHPVFLVHKISSTVGCEASSVSYTDKVGSVPIQLELSLILLVWLKPSLTKMDDVSLEDVGIDPQVCHARTQPGNVEWCHPYLSSFKLVPVTRILVEGSKSCNIWYIMGFKSMIYSWQI